ncbi:dynein axonemal assembly factor 3 [Palaemon carinicauda]|uniref:dynein axonemal assembly factor 3 n=1 Tax=Palaemon carinicauda TaxID=392227 RepID=UPI0035B5F7F5
MHGHGLFNWWGFSPAADLLSYSDHNDKAYQILIVGAGDHRHLLRMLARKKHGTKLKIFVLEAHVEVYARIILLLGVCLRNGLGLQERATLLLDLWGNLTLRPISKDYLDSVAQEYARDITDASQYDHLVGIVAASKLKYRERDAMDDVFRSWYKLSSEYDPTLAWDVRLRQLLKNRYDNRRADADWAWHMRLSFRLDNFSRSPTADTKRPNNNKKIIATPENRDGYVGICSGWGKEFLEWRHTGHAFNLAMQTKSCVPNTSLASVAVFSVGMEKHRRLGYWGDLLTGPFPATALASTNIELAKLENGRSKYCGTDVAQMNTEYLLETLWEKYNDHGSEKPNPSESFPEAVSVNSMERSASLEQKQTREKENPANENWCSKEDNRHEHNSRTRDEVPMEVKNGMKDANEMERGESFTEKEDQERGISKIQEGNTRDFQSYGTKVKTVDSPEIQDKLDNTDEFKEKQGTVIDECIKIIEEKPPTNVYISIDGVEIILLSPTRMNDLRNLPEIKGYLDIIYLSTASAHLLTSKLAENHISQHTTLLVESARMMPELTDDQVTKYETQITGSAKAVGWSPRYPAPICHLRFWKENI